MKTLWMLIIAISLPFSAPTGSFCGDNPAARVATFDGVWELTSRIVDGREVPKEEFKGFKLTVIGTNFETRQGDEILHHGTFKIVANKDHTFKLDITYDSGKDKGKTIESLVRWLDVDTIQSCRSVDETKRPEDFIAGEGSGHQLSVMRRVRP